MSYDYVNPYSGEEEETCSVSFAAQQQMAGSVDSPQTEAQYNKSKMLGEWGVITAKLAQGKIPNGTKVLAYTNSTAGSRGYLYVKGGKLWKKTYPPGGLKATDSEASPKVAELFIKSAIYDVSLPQAINAPKTTALPGEFMSLKAAGVLTPGSEFLYHGDTKSNYKIKGIHVKVVDVPNTGPSTVQLVDVETGEKVGQQVSSSAKWWIEKLPSKAETKPSATPIASPTPSPAVNTGSSSVGSMSHEDVAAMFVKIKDDLAKEQGLNIKGANPELDKLVYAKIGEATGYTGDEVKAKIDAYKAQGNKLSVLKKKVLAGTYKVPEGKPAPVKQSAPNSPLAHPQQKAKAPDPKPNGVPTTATPKLAEQIKTEVKKEVDSEPAKHYSDEDVAAAYIIAKDKIVAASNGKWTLYTKDPQLDLEIAIEVGLKTGGLSPSQQKQALANYLGSGKKLSTLKKQLAKQGAFTPQADTLKKSGAAKNAADKAKEVNDKAEAGYTPTPTPATAVKPPDAKSAGTAVPTDTGKPAPKRVEAEARESGDISGISDTVKKLYFEKFKQQGHLSYLSSGSGQNYDALIKVQAEMQQLGHSKNVTLLQLIRCIDEYGAQKAGVDNGKLFEKKVATWLTTPEGTQYIKEKEAQKAKLAEQAKAKAEAEKLAKELEANQPPLPADSVQFQEMSPAKALRFQEQMLEAKPFGPGEKQGLRHYTGSAYTAMNGYLRGISTSISDTDKRHIEPAKRGMRPAPEPMLLRRGTGANQFSTLGIGRGETSLLWGLTGKTFEDKGFLSTSAAGRAAFGGEVALEIEAPAGTPCMWVDNFSKHPGENEMLLQAGCKFKILNVRKEGSTFVMRLRVVDWPGKEN